VKKLFDADTAKSSWTEVQPNVRLWSKADIRVAKCHVCFTPKSDIRRVF
jgi:hypothetical protein